MRNVVLVDYDHTLLASWWRDDMIGGDWDAYHRASIDDPVIEDMRDLVNALWEAAFKIYCITARPEKWRTLTTDTFIKHNIMVDKLIMRPNDCFQGAPELKARLALEFFGDETRLRAEVAMVIDDHEGVAQAFKALGVTVLQVHGRQR